MYNKLPRVIPSKCVGQIKQFSLSSCSWNFVNFDPCLEQGVSYYSSDAPLDDGDYYDGIYSSASDTDNSQGEEENPVRVNKESQKTETVRTARHPSESEITDYEFPDYEISENPGGKIDRVTGEHFYVHLNKAPTCYATIHCSHRVQTSRNSSKCFNSIGGCNHTSTLSWLYIFVFPADPILPPPVLSPLAQAPPPPKTELGQKTRVMIGCSFAMAVCALGAAATCVVLLGTLLGADIQVCLFGHPKLYLTACLTRRWLSRTWSRWLQQLSSG
jgi:hypothetical protein